jgi:hypothetical protein
MKAIRLAIKALATMDPALERTRQERWVEAAAKHTARQYNLKYVPAQPVVGVRADVVFTVGGLPICGISAGSNNRIPAKIMANVIESDMRRLTRPVDWEYSVQ